MMNSQRYYLPGPSLWPIVGSLALMNAAVGATLLIHHVDGGGWVLVTGGAALAAMMVGWFGKVIQESEQGLHDAQVDRSFRWGMAWFIFSEAMFFAAFFGALFYGRMISVPDLASGEQVRLLWPGYVGGWPTPGPGVKAAFTPMAPWGIPAFNTLLLLTSAVTVTWAHWNLKRGRRGQLNLGLALTVALGLIFLGFQAYEFRQAYNEMGLTLGSGIYGATFFMLTGFHGLHVTVGSLMLMVILGRSLSGHFSPEHHFAFEAVAWYWHFVDVVWLLLFLLVYWF